MMTKNILVEDFGTLEYECTAHHQLSPVNKLLQDKMANGGLTNNNSCYMMVTVH